MRVLGKLGLFVSDVCVLVCVEEASLLACYVAREAEVAMLMNASAEVKVGKAGKRKGRRE